MRLLFLASQFPYPPESGATIKSLSVLDYLRARHDVRLLCLRQSPLTPEQQAWANDIGGVKTVAVNRGRNGLNLLRSYLGGVPLSIERNRSRKMERLVAQSIERERPEALFVDGWLMRQYLSATFHGPKLLHEHNAEHVLWRRQAELERHPLRRRLVEFEYQRVRRYEARMLGQFDVVFAVSEEDRAALAALPGAEADIRLLPNLPQQELLHRPELSFERTDPLVFYFGTLSWQPNLEGLGFFLRQVWPLVRERAPGARFLIAGRGAPPALERLASETEGVDFAGPLADPEAQYSRARVFVEATRSGGGTKLKVLNALARGLPVVLSPQAAEGLQLLPGEHAIIADGAEAMAEAVVRLLNDGGLWTALSRSGRVLIRERFVPEVAYAALDEVLSRAGEKTAI